MCLNVCYIRVFAIVPPSTSTEAPSASFSGKSYVQYELKTTNDGMIRRQTGSRSFLELEISLAFRTNKNSGIIIEMRGLNDFAVLQVSIIIALYITVLVKLIYRLLKMASNFHMILVVE